MVLFYTHLKLIQEPSPFLQIFKEWVRSGLIAANRTPIQKRIVEQYLLSIGKIYAEMGTTEPRLNTSGILEFTMVSQLAAYAHQYPPPPLKSALTNTNITFY